MQRFSKYINSSFFYFWQPIILSLLRNPHTEIQNCHTQQYFFNSWIIIELPFSLLLHILAPLILFTQAPSLSLYGMTCIYPKANTVLLIKHLSIFTVICWKVYACSYNLLFLTIFKHHLQQYRVKEDFCYTFHLDFFLQCPLCQCTSPPPSLFLNCICGSTVNELPRKGIPAFLSIVSVISTGKWQFTNCWKLGFSMSTLTWVKVITLQAEKH